VFALCESVVVSFRQCSMAPDFNHAIPHLHSLVSYRVLSPALVGG
jgi:hypothetical protein